MSSVPLSVRVARFRAVRAHGVATGHQPMSPAAGLATACHRGHCGCAAADSQTARVPPGIHAQCLTAGGPAGRSHALAASARSQPHKTTPAQDRAAGPHPYGRRRNSLRPLKPMSGRPFLWARQKAGGLSGWRICSGSTRLMDAHPILNGSLKDIDVYDCEVSELDAIARDTGLADRAAISARQVGLVVEAKHIDRNASRVGAQANTVKLSRRPIGVGDGDRLCA